MSPVSNKDPTPTGPVSMMSHINDKGVARKKDRRLCRRRCTGDRVKDNEQ